MDRLYTLKIKFVGRVEDTYKGGDTHEKLFWKTFLDHPKAIDDYLLWYYLESINDFENVELIAGKVIQNDDIAIIKEILDKLPEKSSSAMRLKLLPKDESFNSDDYMSKAGSLRLQKQFLNPRIVDVELVNEEVRGDIKTCKLDNVKKYNLDAVTIIINNSSAHMVILAGSKVIFSGEFNSLLEAQEGFERLYGERKIEKRIRPLWSNMEF